MTDNDGFNWQVFGLGLYLLGRNRRLDAERAAERAATMTPAQRAAYDAELRRQSQPPPAHYWQRGCPWHGRKECHKCVGRIGPVGILLVLFGFIFGLCGILAAVVDGAWASGLFGLLLIYWSLRRVLRTAPPPHRSDNASPPHQDSEALRRHIAASNARAAEFAAGLRRSGDELS